MYRKILILLLLFSTIGFAKPIVTVSHPVQEYFIKKIAQNRVYIRTVFDVNEKFSFDNKRLIDKLSNGNYYFILNLKEEKKIAQLFKSKNSKLQVFNMVRGIKYLKDKKNNIIPYVWMDPLLVRKIAKNTYDDLVKIMSYDKKIFKKNLDIFLDELDEIYFKIKKKIDKKELYGFFSFGNYLDYFAKRYRLDVYHRDFRYINAPEVKNLIKFSRKNLINHIVFPTNKSYLLAQSLAGHISGKIVDVNVYDMHWKVNLFEIVRKLIN